ncbi:MAG TPA: M23 family metallopeptidase [Gemmatimonadales bacterium]|nr:M23 family metallopeptidase [Gemmatimonadales bacterium]
MRRRALLFAAAGGLAAVLAVSESGAARAAVFGDRLPRARPLVVESAYVDVPDTLGRRETLSDVLLREGVTGADHEAFLAAARTLDVRRLRPGLVFHFRHLVTDSSTSQMMVRLSPARRLWVRRAGSGWSAADEIIPWTPSRVRIAGTISTSLYDALDQAVPDSVLPAAGRQALAWAIADVYDWEIDFTRDVQAGDRFEVLFERLTSPEGERRVGRILAARVDAGRSPNYAFAFSADSTGAAGYYDEQGRSLKRAFLRAPLEFRRISSGFGLRYHPILHIWRKHEGVDLDAAYGTPVRAVADGEVSKIAYEADGYGNYLELRHVNGIRTRYGHLSRYAAGLHVGQRVKQKDVIAYVGSTGLSTGPHLHYEFLVNGQPTDPRRKWAQGAGTPVPSARRAAFDSLRATLTAALEPPAPPRVATAPAPSVAPTGND